MKKSTFYVCPNCGNISVCTGNAEVSCCGSRLTALEAVKAEDVDKLSVEEIEQDWYITSDRPMEKDDYVLFVAFVTGDKIQMYKQYPEWNLQVRIQRRGHGKLVWYTTADKTLRYQYL